MYKKIHKFSDVIQYFSMRNWTFTNNNVVELWRKLDETDREIFPFSMKTVLWLQYYKNYLKGIRVYLLNDPLETVPAAKARRKR